MTAAQFVADYHKIAYSSIGHAISPNVSVDLNGSDIRCRFVENRSAEPGNEKQHQEKSYLHISGLLKCRVSFERKPLYLFAVTSFLD